MQRTPGGIKQPRILFLGNLYNPWSTGCLQTLVELGHDIVVGVYDPLTKGAWRLFGKRLKFRGGGFVIRRAARLIESKTRLALQGMRFPLSGYASLPELCRAKGLRMIRCTNPNGAEFVQEVQQLSVDLIVVAVFARILKQALIEVPPLGCVNVHPSLLPRYRGPEPIYWVLANREKMTGVMIHYIDEGIDSGDIVLQRQLGIRPDETEFTLMQRSLGVADELLREAIPLLIAGRAPRLPQDRSVASYYSFPPRRRTGLQFKLASFFDAHRRHRG